MSSHFMRFMGVLGFFLVLVSFINLCIDWKQPNHFSVIADLLGIAIGATTAIEDLIKGGKQ